MRKGRNGFQQASATVMAKSARNGVTDSRFHADNGQPKRSAVSGNSNELDIARLHALPVNRLRGQFPRWKRILDIILVLVTLPFWLPLMAVVMGVIRLNSRGPIFIASNALVIGPSNSCFLNFALCTSTPTLEVMKIISRAWCAPRCR